MRTTVNVTWDHINAANESLAFGCSRAFNCPVAKAVDDILDTKNNWQQRGVSPGTLFIGVRGQAVDTVIKLPMEAVRFINTYDYNVVIERDEDAVFEPVQPISFEIDIPAEALKMSVPEEAVCV